MGHKGWDLRPWKVGTEGPMEQVLLLGIAVHVGTGQRNSSDP